LIPSRGCTSIRTLHSGICGKCKVPAIWARDALLDGDNTSISKAVPIRGAFYEAGEVDNLITSIKEVAPLPFERRVFDANKRAHRAVFQGTLAGATGAAARKIAPRLLLSQLEKVTPGFGAGKLSVESYRRGGPLVVRCINSWNDRLLPADVAGAFEAVEGTECEVDVEKGADATYVRVRAVGPLDDEEPGKVAPMVRVLSGSKLYPRCTSCGAPISFQVFNFDLDNGEITERDNGIRVVHQATACLETLLMQIEDDLGDEARALAIDAEAKYVVRKIESGDYSSEADDEKHRLFDYMSLIRRRCLGNPILVDLEGDRLHVRVRNPANPVLLTGRTLGTYSAVMHRPAAARTQLGYGTMEVEVTPA